MCEWLHSTWWHSVGLNGKYVHGEQSAAMQEVGEHSLHSVSMVTGLGYAGKDGVWCKSSSEASSTILLLFNSYVHVLPQSFNPQHHLS